MTAQEQADARRILAMLDLTELSDGAREDTVEACLRKALGPPGKPAAVCLWPQFVSLAARRLQGSGVAVATVVNFPKGGTDEGRVVDDVREALSDGADEIDLVLPYGAFLAGDTQAASGMVEAVRDELTDRHLLKVILETGAFPDAESIASASRLAIASGADFIKTSTGKTAVSATPAAVRTMLEVIHESPEPVGIKPSGGIRTLDDARAYLTLAEAVMGVGWPVPETFRFGASGLHGAIVAVLGGEAAAGGSSY